MLIEFLLLRLVHVIGGMLWVGSAVFTTLFLLPAFAASSDGPRHLMAAMQSRRVRLMMPTVATLTILSGLRLLWITSGGFDGAYFSTRSGMTFALSGAAAIIAFLLGMLVGRPAMARAGALERSVASLANDRRPEVERTIQRLRLRARRMPAIAFPLIVLSAFGMAVARYLA